MRPHFHIHRMAAIGATLAFLSGTGPQVSQALASAGMVAPPDRTDRIGFEPPSRFAPPPDRVDRVGAMPLTSPVTLPPDRADALGTNRFETMPAVIVRPLSHTNFAWAAAAWGAAIASLIIAGGLIVARTARLRRTGQAAALRSSQ